MITFFSAYLNDLLAISVPATLAWPSNSSLEGFIDVYDWDLLIVDLYDGISQLAIQLNLCFGVLPCNIFIIGKGGGEIKLTDQGAIICAATSGCYGVTLDAIRFVCHDRTALVSSFKIQGATLTIRNSEFFGCLSNTDGGVIQSYNQAIVMIYSSAFIHSYSSGFGGAVCAVGSSVHISDSYFHNCSSLGGGGALWASTYAPSYGSFSNVINADLYVESCTFKSCSSGASGGAIMAASNLSNGSVFVYVRNSSFDNCICAGNGGAIRVAGKVSSATVEGSFFTKCRSEISGGALVAEDTGKVSIFDSRFFACSSLHTGGAVAVLDDSFLILIRSIFQNNYAEGLGGGAVQIKSSEILAENCSCTGNTALAGAGGAVLFQGSILSQYQIGGPQHMSCGEGNNAVYGPCLASKYSKLRILDFATSNFTVYPGLAIPLTFVKQDIFNQTILTDSSSLIEVQSNIQNVHLSGTLLAKLQFGMGKFEVIVSPKFSQEDYIAGKAVAQSLALLHVTGLDAEETTCSSTASMQSLTIAVPVSNGSLVCALGSILLLDQNGYGTCSECGLGSYSLNPMAGIKFGSPVCITCPVGGLCSGGSNVTFSVGIWVLENGIYVLTSCPDGHQLVNSFNGIFNQAAQNCLKCQPDEYVLNPNSSDYSCKLWVATIYVEISLVFQAFGSHFTPSVQFLILEVVAKVADVPLEEIMVSDLIAARRVGEGSVQMVLKLAAQNSTNAKTVSMNLNPKDLNEQLLASNLPAASDVSVAIVIGTGSISTPLSTVIGACLGGLMFLIILIGIGYYVSKNLHKQAALRAFMSSFRVAKAGDIASTKHLPFALHKEFSAEKVLGKGAFGLVVQAKKKAYVDSVAIKIVVPERGRFDEKELRQLNREKHVLDMFTAKKCEHAVCLVGMGAVKIKQDLAWFVMELLLGENLECIIMESVVSDVDCIKMTRNALAALKELHSEGLVHRDIKPANIMRCRLQKQGEVWDGISYTFKLVDFGTALGIDEKIAKEAMMTVASNRQMGAGTPPYMSPEMFKDPENAKYSSDIWSLGVTMFEIVTGHLPFKAESDLLWSLAIAGNMDEKAPNVHDLLHESLRPTFDNNLSKVIAKALEKRSADRYQSADEMHDAVYLCLISKGEAFYSVFISYRVASEAPLARLIFDELNHSVTPGGHRVTVYWDAHRLVKGQDWEEGFATGLLNSLCMFPLLSYGSTAPLAALPESQREHDDLIQSGGEERPVGRSRLQGLESDSEDNVLKEFLIARILLQRRDAQDRLPSEKGILKLVYPILIGRQQPYGHEDYPKMGNFFQVQGGGGKYQERQSPPTNRAVAKFLGEMAGMTQEVCQEAEKATIKSTIDGLTKIQGCQLYDHPPDLPGEELSKEQSGLVGKGFAGPPVNLGGVVLTAEQRISCSSGLDMLQLKMLKAEVRKKRADMHEAIDRAVALTAGLARQDSFATSRQPPVSAALILQQSPLQVSFRLPCDNAVQPHSVSTIPILDKL